MPCLWYLKSKQWENWIIQLQPHLQCTFLPLLGSICLNDSTVIKIKKPFALLSFETRLLCHLDNLSYLDKWIFSTSFSGPFFSSTVACFKKDPTLVTLRAFLSFHKFMGQSIHYMKNIWNIKRPVEKGFFRFFSHHSSTLLQATSGWNWEKFMQMLSDTLRLNIHILHPPYHTKIIGHVLKNKEKSKCVCIYKITRLIPMKIKMKMKNRSHRFRHEHK